MKKLITFFGLIFFGSFILNAQIISTVAGGGFSGLGDNGPATSAQLSNCHGLAFDSAGNLYIADGNNHRIRKVDAVTGIITTYAGTGNQGYSGDGSLAINANLNSPWDVVVDPSGNLIIADAMNNRVRKVNASTGVITTMAGIASTNTMFPNGPNGGYNGDGMQADSARLYHPNGLAVDAAGNIYIAEFYNNRVRKISAATGKISTIAGTGSNAYNGDGILATAAAVFGPNGVAVDGAGNVYISENQDQRIRKITASTGLISTIAGNGSYGYSGDGGPASQAQIVPTAILLDGADNIYIASNSCRVRKIDAGTGVITTIAGDGNVGYTGDGGPALAAQFNNISGLVFDAAGNLFIGDAINNRVRKLSNLTIPTSLSNNNSSAMEVKLYPNPFNTTAVLEFSKTLLPVAARIIDGQGRTVREMNLSENTILIEKSDLAAGIYFLEVTTQEGVLSRNKFVIQ